MVDFLNEMPRTFCVICGNGDTCSHGLCQDHQCDACDWEDEYGTPYETTWLEDEE